LIHDESPIEKKIDFLLRQVAAHDSAIARIDDRVDEVNSLMKKTSQEL
jgi:peptidoglycan hydrolase CwlO-like protein